MSRRVPIRLVHAHPQVTAVAGRPEGRMSERVERWFRPASLRTGIDTPVDYSAEPVEVRGRCGSAKRHHVGPAQRWPGPGPADTPPPWSAGRFDKEVGIPNQCAASGFSNHHLRSEPRYNKGHRRALIRCGRSLTPSGSCEALDAEPPLVLRAILGTPFNSALPSPGPCASQNRLGAVSGSYRTERLKSVTALRPTLPPEGARQLPRRLQNVFLLTRRCCL